MRESVTSEEMRTIEDLGQKFGISKLIMMENAGSSIANYLYGRLSKRQSKRPLKIVAIAGTGNNGGDVFVAARHLAYWGEIFDLSLVLVGDERDIHTREAFANWKILSELPKIRKIIVNSLNKLGRLSEEIQDAQAIIIGIFGTGFKGTPRELQLGAIRKINRSRKSLKISVDIPSGMEADTGVSKHSVNSDVTITMHAMKRGMLNSSARRKVGRVVVANIGLPF